MSDESLTDHGATATQTAAAAAAPLPAVDVPVVVAPAQIPGVEGDHALLAVRAIAYPHDCFVIRREAFDPDKHEIARIHRTDAAETRNLQSAEDAERAAVRQRQLDAAAQRDRDRAAALAAEEH